MKIAGVVAKLAGGLRCAHASAILLVKKSLDAISEPPEVLD
jgi:hypothetical protein